MAAAAGLPPGRTPPGRDLQAAGVQPGAVRERAAGPDAAARGDARGRDEPRAVRGGEGGERRAEQSAERLDPVLPGEHGELRAVPGGWRRRL